jgi:hypothetical protein
LVIIVSVVARSVRLLVGVVFVGAVLEKFDETGHQPARERGAPDPTTAFKIFRPDTEAPPITMRSGAMSVVHDGDGKAGAELGGFPCGLVLRHRRRLVQQHHDAVLVPLVEHLRRCQDALPSAAAFRFVDLDLHRVPLFPIVVDWFLEGTHQVTGSSRTPYTALDRHYRPQCDDPVQSCPQQSCLALGGQLRISCAQPRTVDHRFSPHTQHLIDGLLDHPLLGGLARKSFGG